MGCVLIDNHHSELTYSLELLFGRRLGYKVFYPIGPEWYEKGFWKVYDHPNTVRQYLGTHRADPSVYSRPFIPTGSGEEVPDPRFHYCWDPTKNIFERAVTFENFLKNPPDFIVASIPKHVPCFNELIRRYCSRSKLIFQLGNMFSDFSLKGVKNVLNSTERRIPFYVRSVKYSQEFDLGFFSFSAPAYSKKVVNLAHYSSDAELYQKTKKCLPEFTFEAFGAGNESGSIAKTQDVAAKMCEADFIWHLKEGGDGYGHVLHNAAAIGRPAILSRRTYKKLRFGKFLEDGKTCIKVDGLSAEELAKEIRYYSEPSRLEKMSRALHERFCNLVNFDRDEKNIRRFLEKLR